MPPTDAKIDAKNTPRVKMKVVIFLLLINTAALRALPTKHEARLSDVTAREDSAALRCEAPENDEDSRVHATDRIWHKTNLKYHIWYSRDRSLSYKTQEEVMKRAFDQWSRASSKLNFTQTYCLDEADIKISFLEKVTHAGPGEETCRLTLTVPVWNRAIGHAFGPNDGRIHFNDMEDWNYKASPIYTDVYSTALHFTGHVLGLRHSKAKGSVMWSRYTSFTQELSQDDIINIRALYGP